MNQLQSSLQSCVSLALNQFIDKLVEANLVSDKTSALAIWNSSTTDELKVVDGPTPAKKTAPAKKASPTEKKTAPTEKKTKKDDDPNKKFCQYTYVKGDKEGETCGSKVSDESDSGSFCKKHLAHEKKGEEEKKAKKPVAPKKPATTTATGAGAGGKKKATETKEAEAESVSTLKDAAPVFSVKMNKFRAYEHDSTGFLFDRKTEEVYGRQRPDGTVAPLTLDDIEKCKHLGFKYRLPERLASRDDGESEEEGEEEIVESDEEDDDEDDE
jgi:hypothetical protein